MWISLDINNVFLITQVTHRKHSSWTLFPVCIRNNNNYKGLHTAIMAMQHEKQEMFFFRCHLNGRCMPHCSLSFLVVFIFSRGSWHTRVESKQTGPLVLMSPAHTQTYAPRSHCDSFTVTILSTKINRK